MRGDNSILQPCLRRILYTSFIDQVMKFLLFTELIDGLGDAHDCLDQFKLSAALEASSYKSKALTGGFHLLMDARELNGITKVNGQKRKNGAFESGEPAQFLSMKSLRFGKT